jgi:uncharacterized protein with HEPN domain
MHKGDNLLYILTMLEAIEKVFLFADRFDSSKSFFETEDQLFFHASSHLLLAVGEESKKLDNELKLSYPDIPWKAIAGMRDRLAHDYRGINYDLVFSVAKQDLPPLKDALINMLNLIDFDPFELEAALSSDYYKHLKFLKS